MPKNSHKTFANSRPLTCQALRKLYEDQTILLLAGKLGLPASTVARDFTGERTVSDDRLVVYCDGLPSWTQKRQLLAAWLADALPERLRAGVLVTVPADVGRVAESSEKSNPDLLDMSALDADLKAAIRALVDACGDQNVREWLVTTAAILAPLAVHERQKMGRKRRKY